MIFYFLYYLTLLVIFSYAISITILWFWNKKPYTPCSSNDSLKGKTVVVTGSSSGIGRAAATDLARRGARVILACNNAQKAREIAVTISLLTGNKDVHSRLLDTSNLSSVREFAAQILESEARLDVLVLNAGILSNQEKKTSVDGLELSMATNHFGHFLLANLLSGLLKKSPPSRIVVTSSIAHAFLMEFDVEDMNIEKQRYQCMTTYAQTKLCNVYMTRYLADQLQGKGVTVNCFCPGATDTEFIESSDVYLLKLMNNFWPKIVARTPEEGAQTLIYLAVAKEIENITGEFFKDCKIKRSTALSKDREKIKKVWELSEKYVGLKSEEEM